MKETLRRYWPVLPATVLLFLHARPFDFVTDDAFISFRFAHNLARHGQLVFNLGERVEGYTNFLWTVLLAAGIKLGWDPIASSRFLGMALAVGNLALVVRMGLRLDGERPRPAHALAPMLLAGTGAFACWATGGLETQLFTFLFVLGLDLYLGELAAPEQRGSVSALPLALAALTRPEGAFFFGLFAMHRLGTNLARERRFLPRRHEVGWMCLFLAVFGPYFLWRWRYYGWLFPNTFYVKSSGGVGTWRLGLYYLRRFAEDTDAAWILLLALLVRPRPGDELRRLLWTFAALFVAAYGAYVVKVGGDFMGLYRFILPAVVLLALLAQESLRLAFVLLTPLVGRPALAAAGLALAAGYAVGSLHVSREAIATKGADQGIDTPGYLKEYVLDRVPVGEWFRRHAQPDDLMSVGGAGVIPYYAGIRAHDLFGLVDPTIAHDPTATVSNRPGHEKAGEAQLLRRNPTLLTHQYHLKERYVPPPGEAAMWRARGYEWVQAETGSPRTPWYSFLKRVDRAFGPFPPHATSPP